MAIPYKSEADACLRQGRLDDAAGLYRLAIAEGDNAEVCLNLGFILKEQNRRSEAQEFLKKAISIDPGLADAFYMLGHIAQSENDFPAAIEHLKKTLELMPHFEMAYRDLCHVFFQYGDYAAAKDTILKGLSVNPSFADFHYYHGNLLSFEMDLDQAIVSYKKALDIQPDYFPVYNNLGEAYRRKGELDQAEFYYRKTLALDPYFAEAHSNLLFTLSFNKKRSSKDYLAEARRFGRNLMDRARPYVDWEGIEKSGKSRRLRVAFLSGDLRAHPVAFFLQNILEHLDRERLELRAYVSNPKEDQWTASLRQHFSAWTLIAGLDDDATARKIHEDGIDILIDLAGHTAHNRLPVFARKPAPVQVTWLGYWASTGVEGMDYILADPICVPESAMHDFTEKVWHLPDTRLCFTAPGHIENMEIAPLPALVSEYVTFGCFQAISKITDGALACWGRVFTALPQARLRLQNELFSQPAVRLQFLQRLEKAGISSDRITIREGMPRELYLASHAEVDIILDTFPFPGGTTTCEALWMGVPTLTLEGDSMLSRQGVQIMTCAKLEDWIAIDEEDFVSRAVMHATDLDRLSKLRSGLRAHVMRSPLFDAQRFAKNLEDALFGMFAERVS